MSLRLKIIVILFLIAICYCGFDLAVQRKIVLGKFKDLETQQAQKNLRRCIDAIEREALHIDSMAVDWACWEDTRNFLLTGENNFVKKNISLATFRNTDLNMVLFCNNWGKLVWSKMVESDLSTIQMPEFPSDLAGANHPLLALYNPALPRKGAKCGIYMSKHGPMITASEPILSAGGRAPCLGTLILGRFLDEALVTEFARQTGVDLMIEPLNEKYTGPYQKSVLCQVSPAMLQVSAVIADVSGKGGIRLIINQKTDITSQGAAAMKFAIISVCGAFIAAIAVIFVLLQKSVLVPIANLSEHFTSMADSYDLTAKIHVNRSDEIGVLAQQFNTLVDQLAMARSIHGERSYNNGKSEMAAGLLHNLRNMFSPVISRVCLLKENVSKVSLDKLEAAKAQLIDEKTSLSRKQDITSYIELTYQSLIGLYTNVQTEVDEIAIRAAEIEKIFSSADVDGIPVQVCEKIVLCDLIEHSAKLIPDEFARMLDVQIMDSVRKAGTIKTDPIAMAQVVANIFTNAAESIRSAGKTSGVVRIVAATEKSDSNTSLHLIFTDDGAGAEKARLEKVFERGYTTKNKRSIKLCGLGLHWCANTINALNGRIWLESPGPGQGASVHILLPLTIGQKKQPKLKAGAL